MYVEPHWYEKTETHSFHFWDTFKVNQDNIGFSAKINTNSMEFLGHPIVNIEFKYGSILINR